MRKCYHSHGAELFDAIQNTDHFPVKGISAMESGTHLLIQIDTKMTDHEIKESEKRNGILLHCLSDFCIGKKQEYDHILVLNYSIMNKNDIFEVIHQLADLIE